MSVDSTPPVVQVGDVWYRAEVWGKIDGKVHYQRWYVSGVTPKGVWISLTKHTLQTYPTRSEKRIMAQFTATTHKQAGDRWFSFNTRYVQRTKEGALACLIRRTEYWVSKERLRLRMAEDRLRMLTTAPEEVPLLRTFTFKGLAT